MTALERLFDNEEPKKNAGVTPATTGTTPSKTDTTKGKKLCLECGKEVWNIHTKEGLCKECRASKQAPVEPPTPAPKPAPTPATPKQTPTPAKTKSDGRVEGLKSDKWHNDPASFNQTSFLKKQTGLKTWDLEKAISKLTASDMISVIKEDSANIPRVSEILVMEYGCEKYIRPNGKVKKNGTAKNVEAVQEAQDDDQVDMAAIMEEIKKLKASNKALKAANTRMSKAS